MILSRKPLDPWPLPRPCVCGCKRVPHLPHERRLVVLDGVRFVVDVVQANGVWAILEISKVHAWRSRGRRLPARQLRTRRSVVVK